MSKMSQPYYVLFRKCSSAKWKSFYMQTNRVVTGDNNFVSIANIALHHVILQVAANLKTLIPNLNVILMIFFFSQTKTTTDNIKNKM